jgi:hypothetical protein
MPRVPTARHADDVHHRRALGEAELAVVDPGQQEAGHDPVQLGREGDHDAGVGEGLAQLELEELVAAPAQDAGVDGDHDLQVLRLQAAHQHLGPQPDS